MVKTGRVDPVKCLNNNAVSKLILDDELIIT